MWFHATMFVVCFCAVTEVHAQAVPRAFAGHYEMVPALLGGLKSEDSAVRARCVFLLGQIGDRKTVSAIRGLQRDRSRAVRYQVGIALCQLGDSTGTSATHAALASAADWIRYYAVQSLAALATDRARTILETQRPFQGELIRSQIDEALSTWPWPSAPPPPAENKITIPRSLHELFVEAGGLAVIESDGYFHKGEYLQCVRCNETALFLDPHHVELYGTSAWLLWSLGINDRALSLLRQGLAANPNDWSMWFDAGYHYTLMQNYATAARLLRRAVELGAPPPQSHQYCHALEKSGRPDLALEAWRELLRKHPDDGVAPMHINRLENLLRGEQGRTVET